MLIDQAIPICLNKSARSNGQIVSEVTDSSEAGRDDIKHNCDKKLFMKVYYGQVEIDVINLNHANVNTSIEIF